MTISEAASPSHGASRRARARRTRPPRLKRDRRTDPAIVRCALRAASWTAPITRARSDGGARSARRPPGRGGIARECLPDGAAEPAPALEVLATAGTRPEVLAERDVVSVRGAIERREPRRLEEQVGDPLVGRGVVHRAHRSTSRGGARRSVGLRVERRLEIDRPPPSRCRSWAIARRVLDLTVPSGHSRRSAICAWDRSIA